MEARPDLTCIDYPRIGGVGLLLTRSSKWYRRTIILLRDSQFHWKQWVKRFDYIHTSLKILEEITRRAGGVRLREDNILFMLSARLKDLANKYGVFIMSATQLNSDYQDSETPDQNLLRGAKSIADRIDVGMILLGVTDEDLTKLEPILEGNKNLQKPNIKLSIYKNRRGRYKGCFLWCSADLGTCRIHPQFCTNWRMEMLSIEDIKVIVDEGPAAWEQ